MASGRTPGIPPLGQAPSSSTSRKVIAVVIVVLGVAIGAGLLIAANSVEVSARYELSVAPLSPGTSYALLVPMAVPEIPHRVQAGDAVAKPVDTAKGRAPSVEGTIASTITAGSTLQGNELWADLREVRHSLSMCEKGPSWESILCSIYSETNGTVRVTLVFETGRDDPGIAGFGRSDLSAVPTADWAKYYGQQMSGHGDKFGSGVFLALLAAGCLNVITVTSAVLLVLLSRRRARRLAGAPPGGRAVAWRTTGEGEGVARPRRGGDTLD